MFKISSKMSIWQTFNTNLYKSTYLPVHTNLLNFLFLFLFWETLLNIYICKKKKKKKKTFSTAPVKLKLWNIIMHCFLLRYKDRSKSQNHPLLCFISSATKHTNTVKMFKAIKLTLSFGFLYNQTISTNTQIKF